MADGKKLDEYWLNMGVSAVNALADVLLPNLTPRRKEIVGECLAGLFSNAFAFGVKVGRLQERCNKTRTGGEE